MKRLLVFSLLMTWICIAASAQTLIFAYDNSGNRISRGIQAPPAAQREVADSLIAASVVDSVYQFQLLEQYETALYPNASDGLFHILLKPDYPEAHIVVVDARGIVQYESHQTGTDILIDIRGKAVGPYIVKWRTREETYTAQIIKY